MQYGTKEAGEELMFVSSPLLVYIETEIAKERIIPHTQRSLSQKDKEFAYCKMRNNISVFLAFIRKEAKLPYYLPARIQKKKCNCRLCFFPSLFARFAHSIPTHQTSSTVKGIMHLVNNTTQLLFSLNLEGEGEGGWGEGVGMWVKVDGVRVRVDGGGGEGGWSEGEGGSG